MHLLLALPFLLAPQETPVPAAEVEFLTAADFGEVPEPRLDRSEYRTWQKYLRPTAEEAAFEAIPWLPTFGDGIRAAEDAQRPLLLWVMNGHPLGCT